MNFDEKQFKQVMSHWVTGISVVTIAHAGEMRGFTANSFASVSVDPLLISLSAAKSLHTLERLLAHGAFAVNILAKEQKALGGIFAGFPPVDDRFEGLDVTMSELGNPLLPDVLGWLDCRVYDTVDVGASTLILGEVINGKLYEGREALAYFNRQWGQFTATEA